MTTKKLRCAVYTRKSTEHGLELEFNSLDAQREACEAYIKSQVAEGWQLVPTAYNDGAYSGGDLDFIPLRGSCFCRFNTLFFVELTTRSKW